MTRLIRLLLLAVLLGPQVGALVPSELLCSETQDCCTPDGGCDVNCVACGCCLSRTVSLTPIASLAPIQTHAGSLNGATATVRLPLRPTDILHVPKSA